MAGLGLNNTQRRELALHNYLIEELPTDSQPWATYHNPKTGQEFHLPVDGYSLMQYRARGLALGRAPEHLRKAAPVSSERPELQYLQASRQGVSAEVSNDLADVVRALLQEVRELKARVNQQPAPAGPVQGKLF